MFIFSLVFHCLRSQMQMPVSWPTVHSALGFLLIPVASNSLQPSLSNEEEVKRHTSCPPKCRVIYVIRRGRRGRMYYSQGFHAGRVCGPRRQVARPWSLLLGTTGSPHAVVLHVTERTGWPETCEDLPQILTPSLISSVTWRICFCF